MSVNGAVHWLGGVYQDLSRSLPTWLSYAIALAVVAFLVLVVVRFFTKIVLRLIGLVVSVGLGIGAHLLLQPALTWTLERFTSWRTG